MIGRSGRVVDDTPEMIAVCLSCKADRCELGFCLNYKQARQEALERRKKARGGRRRGCWKMDRIITVGDVSRTLAEWITVTGVCKETVKRRYAAGMSVEDAVSTPKGQGKQSKKGA